jgi:AcrR family transcriptional regulator
VSGYGAVAAQSSTTQDALDVRARIVAAAMLMFRSRGYDATSMNAIGAGAGISGPSIYHYFPTKTDLLFECLYTPMREQVETCRAAILDLPPERQLAAFVGAMVCFVLDFPITRSVHGDAYFSMGVLATSLPDEKRRTLQDLIHEHIRDLRDVIVAGMATGVFRKVDATAGAFAVLGIAQNVTWLRPGGRLGPDQLADLYAELAVDMLRPRPVSAHNV